MNESPFPKQYDAADTERRMQELWARSGVYRFDAAAPGPVFSIDTPPPTVSGSLHIGHVFSYTQAEIVARYRRMRGYNVFYPFGFDNNGLPTERLVERTHGVRAADMDRAGFSTLCAQTAAASITQFRALWESLGFSADWEQVYDTAGDASARIAQRLFLELARKGSAYVKQAPVHWCTECRTSIAQAELEAREEESVFHRLAFSVEEDTLPVATTRPELLSGCVCVFVHPQDARYRGLIGKTARVPLFGHEVPILANEEADREKGTGAVLCATYGDAADVQWCARYALPYRKTLLPDGTLDPSIPFVGGMTVRQARAQTVRLLQESGLLLGSEPLRHMVAVHERCGTPVEILPSRQWYIDVLSHKQAYLEAAERIEWYPKQMKRRYLAWVENLQWDWCVSRQRYFGVPIPVWYCARCHRPLLPADSALPLDPRTQAPPEPCTCGCTDYTPETAVLDTWATSSLTPQINARLGEADDRSGLLLPMTLRTQAHEIIRTWAFYTIVRSLYHTGKLPWKQIMISGFVLARPGEKISKSKNNAALEPGQLVRTYSADVLRLWTAGAKLGTDTFFSPAELSGGKRLITKFYNAARFACSHLEDYAPAISDTADGADFPADRWIQQRARETTRTAAALLDRYEIGAARLEIDAFFWHDFCDNYLELVKTRLYEPERFAPGGRQSGQRALYTALLTLLKLYAPYIPHITEYLYQGFFLSREPQGSAHSLHRTQWDCAGAPPDEALGRLGEALKAALSDARRYKTERGLSMKAPLDTLRVRAEPDILHLLMRAEGDLAACCGAREVLFTTD